MSPEPLLTMVLNFQHFLRLLDASFLCPSRSWTKSESSNSETSYEYVASEYLGSESRYEVPISEKRSEQNVRMETIPEEYEPKVSVKEILARFENLRDEKQQLGEAKKDRNNNGLVTENIHLKKAKKADVVIVKEHKKGASKEGKLLKEKKQEAKVYASSTSVLELVTQVSEQCETLEKDSDKNGCFGTGSSSSLTSASSGCSASSSGQFSGDSGTGSAEKEVHFITKDVDDRKDDMGVFGILSVF